MKKSEIRKIIKEEIQRLNEVKGYENLSSLPEKWVVGNINGEFIDLSSMAMATYEKGTRKWNEVYANLTTKDKKVVDAIVNKKAIDVITRDLKMMITPKDPYFSVDVSTAVKKAGGIKKYITDVLFAK